MIDLEQAVQKLGIEHYAGLHYIPSDPTPWTVWISAMLNPDGSIAEPARALAYGRTWQEAIANIK
jgi:hypothetical protein